jgi:hypothetical protein
MDLALPRHRSPKEIRARLPGRRVSFTNSAVAGHAKEIAGDKLAHVDFLCSALALRQWQCA